MKKFSKLASVALALVLALCCLTGCPAQGVVPSETFEGAVSTQKYVTRDEAVDGFLSQELSGESTTAIRKGYDDIMVLTEADIAKLPSFVASANKKIIYAERGKVSYSSSSSVVVDPTVKKQTVLLLQYEDGTFRYFVPPSEKGEAVTASYYADLMNYKNFLNLTAKSNLEMDMTMSAQGRTAKVRIEINMSLQITENMAKLVLVAKTESKGNPTLARAETYLIQTTEGLRAYVQDSNGNWMRSPSVNVDSITDLIESNFVGDVDASYFVKTSKGFTVDAKKAYFYAQKKLEASGDDSLESLTGMGLTWDSEAFKLDYVVSKGKLAEMSMSMGFSGNVYESGIKIKTDVVVSGKESYTNYGTTEIAVADDLKAYMQQIGDVIA